MRQRPLSNLNQYPVEIQEAAYKEALRAHYKSDLYAFCKLVIGMKDITRRTHGDMIAALESETKRKLIVMPRGTMKSSIGVVAYSMWRLISNPNLRILIDSEVYSNSKNFLREIKAHFVSPQFVDLFGEWKSEVNWSEGEITVKTRTKPYKEASITCGGIETVKVGQHYDEIIGDDLNSGNNSATPEARKKVIQHYQMNTAILEPDGVYVIIGTRYAVDDVIGHVMDNEVSDA